MTDRELLELAAKASFPKSLQTHPGYVAGVLQRWNPLDDDGQALRLAVKLGLDVEMHGCNSMHPYAFALNRQRQIKEEEQPSDGDPYAATRRAIVRAAAEIGKAS